MYNLQIKADIFPSTASLTATQGPGSILATQGHITLPLRALAIFHSGTWQSSTQGNLSLNDLSLFYLGTWHSSTQGPGNLSLRDLGLLGKLISHSKKKCIACHTLTFMLLLFCFVLNCVQILQFVIFYMLRNLIIPQFFNC